MKKIYFTKMSGAGNDFVVIDRNHNIEFELNPSEIKNLCHRRDGIGADGVIIIYDSDKYDFVMEYYNADGSTGSLCGNGARCAIKFANDTDRLNTGKAKFISNGEYYLGEVISEELVKFCLNPPKEFKSNFKIKASGQLINSSFINTGSPHVVIKIDDVLQETKSISSSYSDINEFPAYNLGREIRYHKDFSPSGTNVNFIKIADDKIYIRTYERGVEDETLACGTGSVAAAVIGFTNYNMKPPIKLKTRGGDELVVDFKLNEREINGISLIGPAKTVYKGEFLLNKFL